MQESEKELHDFLTFLKKHRKIVFLTLSLFFFVCFFLFSLLVKKHYLTQFDFNMSVRVQDDMPVKLDKLFQFFSSLASVEGIAILLIILLVFRRKIVQGILIFVIFLGSHIVELFGKIFI